MQLLRARTPLHVPTAPLKSLHAPARALGAQVPGKEQGLRFSTDACLAQLSPPWLAAFPWGGIRTSLGLDSSSRFSSHS